MIYGIGTDIVTVSRIARLHKKYGAAFAERLLSHVEKQEYPLAADPIRYLSKHFAAKEAISKALGTGIRAPVSFRNISVGHDGQGKPEVICEPELKTWMKTRGIKRLHLSLSDEDDKVVAFAVAEK